MVRLDLTENSLEQRHRRCAELATELFGQRDGLEQRTEEMMGHGNGAWKVKEQQGDMG